MLKHEKDKTGAGRSKMIRLFIKDQLTSGKTLVYAYRNTMYNGAWVKTKPHEAEHFRRNISPVSLDGKEREIYSNLVNQNKKVDKPGDRKLH